VPSYTRVGCRGRTSVEIRFQFCRPFIFCAQRDTDSLKEARVKSLCEYSDKFRKEEYLEQKTHKRKICTQFNPAILPSKVRHIY